MELNFIIFVNAFINAFTGESSPDVCAKKLSTTGYFRSESTKTTKQRKQRKRKRNTSYFLSPSLEEEENKRKEERGHKRALHKKAFEIKGGKSSFGKNKQKLENEAKQKARLDELKWIRKSTENKQACLDRKKALEEKLERKSNVKSTEGKQQEKPKKAEGKQEKPKNLVYTLKKALKFELYQTESQRRRWQQKLNEEVKKQKGGKK